MKYLLILLGFFLMTIKMQAQECGTTIFNPQVSAYYPTADLQIVAFFNSAVCEAYQFIEANIGSQENYQNVALVADLNEEAWTTIMTIDKVNTAFAGKSDLKNLYIDNVLTKKVRGCIEEIENMALLANSYESFIQDLILFVGSHLFLNLSPPEQQQLSTLVVMGDHVLQFAKAQAMGGKGGDFAKVNWWASWGRCVFGTIGGAVSGGTAGAMGGAVAGGIGAIPGGIAGAIGGGLTGAATFCGE